MPAEGARTADPREGEPGRGLPTLEAVRVADEVQVEPQLRRAAADLAALRLRLAAASRRAHAAESRALAAKPTSGLTADEEAAALDDRLRREQAAHRRSLDDEMVRVEAEGAELVAAARAEAASVVAAASAELTTATGGAPAPVVAPLAGTAAAASAEVSMAPPSVPVSQEVPPRPSFAARVFHRDLGPSLVEVAIVVLLVALLVAVVR